MEFGCVSLRVWHPTESLAFLSDVLGLEPFRTWMVGTPSQTPGGNAAGGTNDESYWVSRLEFDPRTGFSNELTRAVDLLAQAEIAVRTLAATGGRIEIFVALTGWINNGDSMSPALLRRIADLGVTLTIEVFAN
jgi:hypothetical protein